MQVTFIVGREGRYGRSKSEWTWWAETDKGETIAVSPLSYPERGKAVEVMNNFLTSIVSPDGMVIEVSTKKVRSK